VLLSPIRGELRRVSAELPVTPDAYRTGVHLDRGRPYYVAPAAGAFRIFFCAMPDLVVAETLTLRSSALGPLSRHGAYFVSASSEETVGFHSDGARAWKRHPMEITEPVDGISYFTDHRNRRARIGVLEIATGEMTVLHEE
jgi:hypothetical protein